MNKLLGWLIATVLFIGVVLGVLWLESWVAFSIYQMRLTHLVSGLTLSDFMFGNLAVSVIVRQAHGVVRIKDAKYETDTKAAIVWWVSPVLALGMAWLLVWLGF